MKLALLGLALCAQVAQASLAKYSEPLEVFTLA
jgi:hypothetical protein